VPFPKRHTKGNISYSPYKRENFDPVAAAGNNKTPASPSEDTPFFPTDPTVDKKNLQKPFVHPEGKKPDRPLSDFERKENS
jgi:hypothetical protein